MMQDHVIIAQILYYYMHIILNCTNYVPHIMWHNSSTIANMVHKND